MDSKRIIRTYLWITGLTTLSQSLIWGINTLFLLAAGMNIFQVMIINAAYTAGMLVFEVPTGVIADTLGRRISYLFSIFTIFISTVIYGYFGYIHASIWPFVFASVLTGLGFTFYTGAVDAWMIDALKTYKYKGKVDIIFARSGVIFGLSMLIGTTAGGFLGQYQLWIPYAVRAFLLIPAFILGWITIKDIGFTSKKLVLSKFGKETAKIARVGIKYGLNNRVVRFLMLCTFVQSLFYIYGFYSWQKYFLDLLGQNLIWISGIIAALVGLSQILGNLLVVPVTKRFTERGEIVIFLIALQSVATIGAAVAGNFYIAVGLYLVVMISFGLMTPIKAAWLNSKIPSTERATLISLDALFGDVGGTIGQLGLGYLSKSISIPFAWIVGGIVQLMGVPLARRAKLNDNSEVVH